MYKKVTHNIMEEHFSHPMAIEIKNTIDRAKVWPEPPSKFSYRVAVRFQFICFNQALRDVMISTLFSTPDLEYNKTKLNSIISNIGSLFVPYYGQANVDMLVGHLSSFATVYTDIVTAIKNSADFAAMQVTAFGHLTDVNKLITTITPQWWTVVNATADNYLTDYAQLLIQQAVSRHASNWIDDNTDFLTASKIISNGPIFSVPYNGAMDYSTQLSNSIEREFSTQFS